MFGLIFHWGLYSVFAYDDITSARRRKMGNGAEWYKKRLLEKGTFRPISGWKETQEFHRKTFKEGTSYDDLIGQFDGAAEQWNPDKWMELVVESKAEYVILTTKNHDGFCLWDTKTNSLKSKRNIVKEFVESARKHNLKVGLYYSWSEFGVGCTIDYLKKVSSQIDELSAFNPDIWWFDGDWECKSKYSLTLLSAIVERLKKKGEEVNDRIGLTKEQKADLNNLYGASFRNYGDRYLPSSVPDVPWEHINTIGLSWGRNEEQEEKDYKMGKDLFELWKKVNEMGGRFLLNLGPNKDGSLDEFEVTSLKEFVGEKDKVLGRRCTEITSYGKRCVRLCESGKCYQHLAKMNKKKEENREIMSSILEDHKIIQEALSREDHKVVREYLSQTEDHWRNDLEDMIHTVMEISAGKDHRKGEGFTKKKIMKIRKEFLALIDTIPLHLLLTELQQVGTMECSPGDTILSYLNEAPSSFSIEGDDDPVAEEFCKALRDRVNLRLSSILVR